MCETNGDGSKTWSYLQDKADCATTKIAEGAEMERKLKELLYKNWARGSGQPRRS